MAATQKMNFLTLISFTPSDTFSLGRTVLPQYKTLQTTTDDRQTTQCTEGSTDSMVGQKHRQNFLKTLKNTHFITYSLITRLIVCLCRICIQAVGRIDRHIL